MKKCCSVFLILENTNKFDFNYKKLKSEVIDKLCELLNISYNRVSFELYGDKHYRKDYSIKNMDKLYKSFCEFSNKVNNVNNKSFSFSFYKHIKDEWWDIYAISIYFEYEYIKIELDLTDVVVDLKLFSEIANILDDNNMIIRNGFVHYYSRKSTVWMLLGRVYVDFMFPSEIVLTNRIGKCRDGKYTKISDIYYLNIINKKIINDVIIKKIKQILKENEYLENENYLLFMCGWKANKLKKIIGKEKFV